MIKGLFNRKAVALQERIDQLETALLTAHAEAKDLRVSLLNQEAYSAGQNAQIIELRGIANEMRDRVRSHGKTHMEKVLIEQCTRVHKQGRGLAYSKFKITMDKLVAERESMTDWTGETMKIEIPAAARAAVENAANVKAEAF